MANVRDTNGTTDRLFLGGSGGTPSGWGVIWVGRLLSITSDQPRISIVNGTSNTIGVLYTAGSNILAFGSASSDVVSPSSFTWNTTDVWALGVTKAAGTVAPRFHARNLTTAAASAHADATTTATDVAATWGKTEIGSADNGGFVGNGRHGTAAVFTSVYSDANFDTILTSTAQLYALTPARLWDFNQASTGTAVVNLMTGSADQSSITGTTVTADAAFDFWTFGTGGGAAPEIPILVMAPPIPA